ncbi:MAG: phosphoribosylglycinamide formyltransferase [Cyclobacteriaceae bacterium]|jgi:phosphoribosylglycinamide formyltransferase-1|nr:phosphoribosylglycinamide formyltransferase [Cyclobacteriaceae bacterium]
MNSPIRSAHHNTVFRIAIFASGSGTNAEEIFKFFKGHPRIEVVTLLSNNPQAYALERAKKYGVPTLVFDRKEFRESSLVSDWLKQHQVTHLVLAGFLWLIPENLIRAYSGKIINIHPALLPKFGGKGMYGMKVHEAVKAAGETETGITIHEVNEHYDEGRILFKAICPVKSEDSPEDIAKKVHQLEYAHYPSLIEQWILIE